MILCPLYFATKIWNNRLATNINDAYIPSFIRRKLIYQYNFSQIIQPHLRNTERKQNNAKKAIVCQKLFLKIT